MDSRLKTLAELLNKNFDITDDAVLSIISDIAAETGKAPEDIIQEALTAELTRELNERNKLNPH